MSEEQKKADITAQSECNGLLVEEDGDEVFTEMPNRCTRFACNGFLHQNIFGFFVCNKCGYSYGSN